MIRYSMEHFIFILGADKKNNSKNKKNTERREVVRFTNTLTTLFKMFVEHIPTSYRVFILLFGDTQIFDDSYSPFIRNL